MNGSREISGLIFLSASKMPKKIVKIVDFCLNFTAQIDEISQFYVEIVKKSWNLVKFILKCWNFTKY